MIRLRLHAELSATHRRSGPAAAREVGATSGITVNVSGTAPTGTVTFHPLESVSANGQTGAIFHVTL
jgi:hypothetical protein